MISVHILQFLHFLNSVGGQEESAEMRSIYSTLLADKLKTIPLYVWIIVKVQGYITSGSFFLVRLTFDFNISHEPFITQTLNLLSTYSIPVLQIVYSDA